MPNASRYRPSRWSSWFSIAALATLSGPVLAQQTDAAEAEAAVALAEQKAAQAFEAFQRKRFAEAVALYVEAYDTAPNADILYNIARIYDTKLGDRPLAISFYRRYITDPGAVPDRIQLANERLVALREAEIAATSPAPAPASDEPRATVDVVSVRTDEPPREGEWNAAEVTGVLMSAVGIAAIGVGAGYGLSAMEHRDALRDNCDGNVCADRRGLDAAEKANDHALVSTIGFASGGALLALGAAFYFWLGDEPAERTAQSAEARLQLGARQNHGGWSLEVAGSW